MQRNGHRAVLKMSLHSSPRPSDFHSLCAAADKQHTHPQGLWRRGEKTQVSGFQIAGHKQENLQDKMSESDVHLSVGLNLEMADEPIRVSFLWQGVAAPKVVSSFGASTNSVAFMFIFSVTAAGAFTWSPSFNLIEWFPAGVSDYPVYMAMCDVDIWNGFICCSPTVLHWDVIA